MKQFYLYISCFFVFTNSCSRDEVGKDPAISYGPGETRAAYVTPESALNHSEPTVATLANRMRKVYQDIRDIEFEAKVNHNGLKIHCSVISKIGHHYLEVRREDREVIYKIEEQTLPDGNIQIRESCPSVNKVAEYVVTPDEFNPRRWDIKLSGAEHVGFDECLFGIYLQSWIGATAHEPEFWERTIREGRIVSTDNLNGVDCYIVATDRPQRRGEEIWVGIESGLVLRWRDSVRDREFTYRRLNAHRR